MSVANQLLMVVGVCDDAHLRVVDDLDEIVTLARRPDPLFVRYSEGPDRDRQGPSRDYESGLTLPGLSVALLTPPDWWSLPPHDWVARRLRMYAHLMAAPRHPRPWLLGGRVVGTGPDHEPLVAEAAPIAWVGTSGLAAAVRIYRERFVVGQDSRCLPARDPA